MNDLISRQAALDIINTMPTFYDMNAEKLIHQELLIIQIECLPSAQPERSNKEFIKLTVRNSNGRPYYSIIYLEIDKNGVGHDFEGYSSYDLDVISDFLRKDFGIGQPERKTGKWMRQEADCVWADICSECGEAYIGENYSMSSKPPVNFCPNCGADMRGETDE